MTHVAWVYKESVSSSLRDAASAVKTRDSFMSLGGPGCPTAKWGAEINWSRKG